MNMTRLTSALYWSLSLVINNAFCMDTPIFLKSSLMVLISVVFGLPTGLLIGLRHSRMVCFAGASSGRRHMCPKRVRRRCLQVSDYGLALVIL